MFSLNEVEATAKKAARGAGYSWGVADEAGFAARWLTARGVDGCAALAALLRRMDGVDFNAAKPVMTQDDWAAAGPLCPLLTGCLMSDLGRRDYSIGPVAVPILVLPFIAGQGGATIETASGTVTTDGESVCFNGIIDESASRVIVAAPMVMPYRLDRSDRANPDPAAWARLLAFAHRTYAPATEESRLKGAG
ncbi:DUF3726 domain-containing protein [Loktanella sp. F6476L]|uniref:DUF3726 domain-containing protein n=1 Tax=Loktanella sp. F6476L TaxID=2926405 RepID=UPI001FF316C4|nr:DUF3726 domain-containing protein [Loktanella sp. F6476L]MCK0122396.1 DUF3726 domain-containing protein [Loktanella sp. F6476L]